MKPILLTTLFLGIGILIAILNINYAESTKISLSDLFPARKDIGTEWRINESPPPEATDKAGLLDSLGRSYVKGSSGYDITILKVSLYLYDSKGTANDSFTTRVDEIIEKGGFKELNVSGMPADKCYGSAVTNIATDTKTIRCYKDSIYFVVSAYTQFGEVDENELKRFTSITSNKIAGLVSNNKDTTVSNDSAKKLVKTEPKKSTVTPKIKSLSMSGNEDFDKLVSTIIVKLKTDVTISGRVSSAITQDAYGSTFTIEPFLTSKKMNDYIVVIQSDKKQQFTQKQCVEIGGKVESIYIGLRPSDQPNVYVQAKRITTIGCDK